MKETKLRPEHLAVLNSEDQREIVELFAQVSLSLARLEHEKSQVNLAEQQYLESLKAVLSAKIESIESGGDDTAVGGVQTLLTVVAKAFGIPKSTSSAHFRKSDKTDKHH